MAAVYERTNARLLFRLNTGAHPETGKPVLKSVGMVASPTATADNCAAVKAAIAPLLVHPAIATEYTFSDVLGEN